MLEYFFDGRGGGSELRALKNFDWQKKKIHQKNYLYIISFIKNVPPVLNEI